MKVTIHWPYTGFLLWRHIVYDFGVGFLALVNVLSLIELQPSLSDPGFRVSSPVHP